MDEHALQFADFARDVEPHAGGILLNPIEMRLTYSQQLMDLHAVSRNAEPPHVPRQAPGTIPPRRDADDRHDGGLFAMSRRTACIAFALLIGSGINIAAGATPRIGFVRILPPPHDLGAQSSVALIYAMGDSDRISTFVDVFSDHTGRELHFENAIEHRQHLIGNRIDETRFAALRREHPADVYLGVNHFTCALAEHKAPGSEHGVDGERVKRNHVWADATCSARVDIVSGETGKRTTSFQVRGEGTSPRVSELTDEERNVALDSAAKYAAIEAQEAITPRKVRESIELDDSAPSFGEGMSMIASARFEDARAIWESTLRRHEDSAALQFDLGAVCEAIGDLPAARGYYQQALHLSPHLNRYRVQLDLFRKRNAETHHPDAR